MVNVLEKQYGLSVLSCEKSSVGAGSDTYFVVCSDGKYVVKFPSVSEINNIEFEPELCEFLLQRNIAVCRFMRNLSGEYISQDSMGRKFHVQKFIEGKMYDWNTAPQWLLDESAETLGKIHTALNGYSGLPTGIGADFFKYMTPENALRSYENTLIKARETGDKDTEKDLNYRIEQMKCFPKYEFDLSKLTCGPTHGDYFISQLLCGEDKINAVIDWTTACVHPLVWEIMRSYVYAAPECSDGEINIQSLKRYFNSYMKYAELTPYDLEMAAKLFWYQIAVCDYYNQYYTSTAANCEIYLHQARFSTKLMMWFERNIGKLTDALSTGGYNENI